MKSITIRKAKKKDGRAFLSLVSALARYEKLAPPTKGAKARLLHDAFGKRKRFETNIAFDNQKAIAYAIFFETYSSFLALPILYLEDIFVLPEYRNQGVGFQLFCRCVTEAQKRGCGRMEWMVLDWNLNAVRFYENIGARQLTEWFPFRLERNQFKRFISG